MTKRKDDPTAKKAQKGKDEEENPLLNEKF